MIKSTSKTIVSNALWSTVDQLSAPLIQIIQIPIFLKYLGKSDLGKWIFVGTIFGLSSIFSIGTSAAIITQTPKQGDLNYQKGFVKIIAASLIVLVAMIIFSAFAILLMRLNIESQLVQCIDFWSVQICLLSVLAIEFDQIFANTLRSLQHYQHAGRIESISRVIGFVILSTIAIKTKSLNLLLFANLIILISKSIAKLIVVNQHLSILNNLPDYRKIWPAIIDQVKIGKWLLMQTISASIFLSLDRWIIARELGTAKLADYNICLQLAQLPHMILTAACQTIVPQISRKTDELGLVKFDKEIKISLIFSVTLCVLFPLLNYFASDKILSTWISDEFASQNRDVLNCLTVAFLLICVNIPPYYMLWGIGKVKYASTINLGCGLLSFSAFAIIHPSALIDFARIRIGYGLFLLSTWLVLLGCVRMKSNISANEKNS